MDYNAVITSPSLINGVGYLLVFDAWIRQRISRPRVMALIRQKESIVDMMVAKIPTKKSPNNMGGRTSAAIRGKDMIGDSGITRMKAYNPVMIVRQSKTNQKPIEIRIPFRAISGDSAAAQR